MLQVGRGEVPGQEGHVGQVSVDGELVLSLGGQVSMSWCSVTDPAHVNARHISYIATCIQL